MLKGYVSNLTRATLILCVYSPPPSSLHSPLSASLSALVHVSDSWLILQREKKERGRERGEMINHLFIQSKVNKKTTAVLRNPSIEPLTPTDARDSCLRSLSLVETTPRVQERLFCLLHLDDCVSQTPKALYKYPSWISQMATVNINDCVKSFNTALMCPTF